MPSLEQLLLVALGLSCFYPGSSTRSCPPSWATLVWDVPPLELEEKGAAHKGITAPQLLCWSIPALCLLLLGVFLGCSLCRKARSCWRKVRRVVPGSHGDKEGPSQTLPSPQQAEVGLGHEEKTRTG